MAFSFKKFFSGVDDSNQYNSEYDDQEYANRQNFNHRPSQDQGVGSQNQKTFSPGSKNNKIDSNYSYTKGKNNYQHSDSFSDDTSKTNDSPEVNSHIDLFVPKVFSDAKTIVNQLLLHEAVIVNFSAIEKDQSSKIVDFVAGAIYAVEGSIEKISNNIWLIAPNNYSVSGSGSALNSVGQTGRNVSF